MREQSAVTPTSLGPPAGQATEFELIGHDRLEGASVETALGPQPRLRRRRRPRGRHRLPRPAPARDHLPRPAGRPGPRPRPQPRRRDRRPQRRRPRHPGGDRERRLRRATRRETPCRKGRCSRSLSSTTPSAEPAPSPTTTSATATHGGSARTSRRCVTTRFVDPAATVASDVDRLRSAAAISRRVTVSGHVYDVATGLVETVIPAEATAARNGGA